MNTICFKAECGCRLRMIMEDNTLRICHEPNQKCEKEEEHTRYKKNLTIKTKRNFQQIVDDFLNNFPEYKADVPRTFSDMVKGNK